MRSKLSLAQLQSLPLEAKIILTQKRIKEWYEITGGECYISYSGGKDSLVLLTLVREIYPDCPAVFVDTGLEYPEVKEFALNTPNVTIIKPKISFRRVIIDEGYPVVSKEIAQAVREANLSDGLKYAYRLRQFEGTHPVRNFKSSAFLLNAPFKISEKCCNHLKKNPLKEYTKKTGRYPFVGTLAQESNIRQLSWIRYGCNSFETSNKRSQPLAFWTEQSILQFLYERNMKIPSVYGEIIKNDKYSLTGLQRTGCMFCLFGAKYDKEIKRFLFLKERYPQVYKYCLKDIEKGGLGMKEVLDFLDIEY